MILWSLRGERELCLARVQITRQFPSLPFPCNPPQPLRAGACELKRRISKRLKTPDGTLLLCPTADSSTWPPHIV